MKTEVTISVAHLEWLVAENLNQRDEWLKIGNEGMADWHESRANAYQSLLDVFAK